MKISIQKKLKSNRGQGLIEYLILVALIAVGSIGVMKVVGQNVAIQYENLNRAMGASIAEKRQVLNADESTLNRKDLSNFMDSSRTSQ
ncbi:MAG: hypothetical protein A2622_08640 [Bdellovibrionales bacterium RIFCSPHIGHO2_01_FULL_40_29]|nr:MAG: hypothetical protein A2622_08640 [Bdellovibrionales bacterium RIFCSPHIGHO2_01_FULL_40_29]OFZ35555.1 MAG: hypothetical protein A3D17_07875 [Bdellovibrionales bacterium RIFCSPHIGHO2_02_FULL_40_15]